MIIFKTLDNFLKGQPDRIITLILIALGTLAWLVALFGTPTLRLLLTGWYLAP